MKKIPVGQTIAHAYGFAFGEFVPLLKLTWLPFVAVLVGQILVVPQLQVISQGIRTHDYSGMTMSWPLFLLLYAAMILMTTMWLTAIYQYALGRQEAQHRWFYFSLAKPIWRIIGAVLLMFLILLVLLVIYALAIVVLLFLFRLGLSAAHISDTAMKGIATFDALLAFAVGYCAFIFCAMRFGFLLIAATIAENHVALIRSWTLSHGNFWRMFVISLAVFLPMLVAESATFYWTGLFPHIPAGATQADTQALQAAAGAVAFAQMRHYWYIIYPGGMVLTFLTYGLLAGAQAFSYRALTDADPTPNRP